MVNGGALEAGLGDSGWGLGRWGVGDPRGRLSSAGRVRGCTSPGLHATNPWLGNEGGGEVRWGLVPGEPPVPVSPAEGYLSRLVYRAPSLARPASQSRVGRRPLRPVLKHGPRSLTCVRAIGRTKPKGAVKAKGTLVPEGRSLAGAAPALCLDLASCRAARAYTLGPERW